MKRVRLKELPDRFERLEKDYRINQKNGWAVVLRPDLYEDPTRVKVLREFDKMCGMCVGGHLAEMGRTEVECDSMSKELLIDFLVERPYEIEKAVPVDNGRIRQIADLLANEDIHYRDYEDGVLALGRALHKGEDFKRFVKEIDFTDSAFGRIDSLMLEELQDIRTLKDWDWLTGRWYDDLVLLIGLYLQRECGAPAQPFRENDWGDIKPSKVFAAMLAKNQNAANHCL